MDLLGKMKLIQKIFLGSGFTFNTYILYFISNGNWTEWGTIQGVIRQVILNRPST